MSFVPGQEVDTFPPGSVRKILAHEVTGKKRHSLLASIVKFPFVLLDLFNPEIFWNASYRAGCRKKTKHISNCLERQMQQRTLVPVYLHLISQESNQLTFLCQFTKSTPVEA